MNPESTGTFFPGPIFPKNFVRDFFGDTQQYEVSLPKQQISSVRNCENWKYNLPCYWISCKWCLCDVTVTPSSRSVMLERLFGVELRESPKLNLLPSCIIGVWIEESWYGSIFTNFPVLSNQAFEDCSFESPRNSLGPQSLFKLKLQVCCITHFPAASTSAQNNVKFYWPCFFSNRCDLSSSRETVSLISHRLIILCSVFFLTGPL